MGLVQQTVIQLVTAFIAFALGILINRLRATWAYFSARKFWRPLLRRDITLVLGDGFTDLRGFEASDMVGRGDLVGSYVLTTRFAAMGFRRLQPVFADKMIGSDPSGAGLRKNLIVLGGRDANTLTGDILSRLNCAYSVEWLDPPAAGDGSSRQIPELQPTSYAPAELTAYRPEMTGNSLVRDYGVIIRARNPFISPGSKDKRIVIIYGCYGFGTLAAVLYSLEQDFLGRIRDTEEDIECIVTCDVVRDAPQRPRHVYFDRHPAGTLGPDRVPAGSPSRNDAIAAQEK